MRSTPDRIRHALSFEIIGLVFVVAGGAIVFGIPVHDIGVVAVVSATLATIWNYVYNLIFDRAMLRLTKTVNKTFSIRIVHTILFEGGMLLVLLPFMAWYLQISLWAAFLLDLSFTIFYFFYTFGFNWFYDRVFPVPDAS